MPIIKIIKKGLSKAQVGQQVPPVQPLYNQPIFNPTNTNPSAFDVWGTPPAGPVQQPLASLNNPSIWGNWGDDTYNQAYNSGIKFPDRPKMYKIDDANKRFVPEIQQNTQPQVKTKKSSDPNKFAFEVGLASIGANALSNLNQQKNFNEYMHNSMMPDNMYTSKEASTSGNRGDYDINNGMFRPNELGFKSKGQTTNAFYPSAQYGLSLESTPGSEVPNYVPNAPVVPMNNIQSAPQRNISSPVPSISTSNNKDSLIYLSHQQGVGGLNAILSAAAAGKPTAGKVGKENIDFNMKNNINTTEFYKKYEQLTPSTFLDYWSNKFSSKERQNASKETKFDPYFEEAAQKTGLSADFLKTVAHIESNFDANSNQGATTKYKGLMQLDVNKYGQDVYDPYKSILATAQTISQNIPKIKFQNTSVADNNEQNNMKIRIIGGPDNHMEYGGQKGYGLDLGAKGNYGDMNEGDYDHIGRTLGPVDRDEANLEAERGETVLADVDNDGLQEHMNIGGKLHSEKDANGNGGTPLKLPEGSFIFSNTKNMKIKDPEILKHFNKTKFEKGGITPADIAKQYDINKYKAILDNPNSDTLSKKTAAMMITNYNKKLGTLALVQESMKGFPQGIPEIAKQALGQGQQQGMPQEAPQEAKYGGYIPVAAYGYDYTQPYAGPGDEYKGGKTKMGRTTPTGYGNAFNMTGNDATNFYNKWEEKVPGYSKLGVRDAQGAQYDWMLKNDPDKVRNMWKTYGLTAEGKKYPDLVGMTGKTNGTPNYKFEGDLNDQQLASLKKGYTDNMMGVRQFTPEDKPTTTTTDGGGGDDFVYVCNGNSVIPMFEGKAAQSGMPYFSSEAEASANCGKKPTDGGGTGDGGGKTTIGEIPDVTPTTSKIPYGWSQQDLNNRLASTFAAANIKKYHPWTPKLNPVLPDVVYDDWRAKAAARQSQFNNAANTMGTYAGGPGLAANLSFMAGQQAEGVSGDIDNTSRNNTNIFNNAEAQRAGILNQFQMINGQNAANNWSDENALDSKFRAATNDAAKAWTATQNQGITNAANAYNLNITESPYYYADPRTGVMKFYNTAAEAKFRSIQNGSYQPQQNDVAAYSNKYKEIYDALDHISDPKLRHEAAQDYMQQFKPNKTVQTSTPGQLNKSRTQTTTYAPSAKKGGVVVGYKPYNPYLGS